MNDWQTAPIIHKGKILDFEFLCSSELIAEVADGYYQLSKPPEVVEAAVYGRKVREIMDKYNLVDLDKELKCLMKKFNTYNELKDIAQALIGRIADMRGVSIRKVHEELNIVDTDACNREI